MRDGATAREVPAYADAVAGFRIETAAAYLHGDLEQGLNACVECCDRHAAADANAIALDWIDAGGRHRSFTFAQMQALSARVANLLVEQGVKPGDVVAGCCRARLNSSRRSSARGARAPSTSRFSPRSDRRRSSTGCA